MLNDHHRTELKDTTMGVIRHRLWLVDRKKGTYQMDTIRNRGLLLVEIITRTNIRSSIAGLTHPREDQFRPGLNLGVLHRRLLVPDIWTRECILVDLHLL